MKKKNLITVITLSLFIISMGGMGYFLRQRLQNNTQPVSQCQVKQITYYYLDTCEVCQEVKSENVIGKIEELGVRVQKINAAIGPIRHKFTTVPTFVINEKTYSGYMTFEQLNELLGCPKP